MKLSLRTKLIGSFLVVILTCGSIATFVGVRLIGDRMVGQVQDKVRLDLNSARVIYREAVGDVRDAVRYTADRFFLRDAVREHDLAKLTPHLEEIRLNEDLDILTLTDGQGKVLFRARNPAIKGDSQATNPIVRKALDEKKFVASTEIVTRADLLKEGEDLCVLANIHLVPTPKASPTEETELTSGMMILAADPVLDNEGKVVGVLYGGRLLNRRYSLVDRIKETVYQGETYRGKDMGTATIFQGDVRISTNVETTEGKRAIGTRVSREVKDRVLLGGEPWIERAFVVNNWYITAYEPMRNVSGEVIGILYVGMLEQKFANMKQRVLLTFLGIMLVEVVLSIGICYVLTGTLMRPINALVLAARRLGAGDLTQRVDPEENTEEIGLLGATFNMMASSIEERDEQLKQRAQQEIMKSERLAMIGRLSAGVAHEINNPLGGILLLSRLLLRKAPPEGIEKENLERIANDAERCQKIVQGLLDFARQRDPEMRPLDLNDVAKKALSLLENQAVFHNVKIAEELHSHLPQANVDESQMVQVFVNLIVNAAEAMKGDGTLTITTKHPADAGRVEISFSDTGEGIPEENVPHLFEPFFTTKEVGHGTGLGLSISHGIVESHGGTISVESRVAEGTVFTVSLPVQEGR
jgi:two-component system NtrC family sensor kinase